jgi:hypothetical protein
MACTAAPRWRDGQRDAWSLAALLPAAAVLHAGHREELHAFHVRVLYMQCGSLLPSVPHGRLRRSAMRR